MRRHRESKIGIAFVVMACAVGSQSLAHAQSCPVITDHAIRTPPSPPALPAAGGTFVDPTFCTTILRVTDANDGSECTNFYSYWPTFNLNSARFFIACDGAPKLYHFDPEGFQILSKGDLFDQALPGGGFMNSEDAIWSGASANLLYGYNGLKLWSFDVVARTYTLVKDFAGTSGATYLGQLSRSINDDVFAFTRKDAGWNATGYLVWRRSTNTLLRNTTVSGLDEVQIDKSGRYLVVKADIASGVDVQIVDLQTGTSTNLTDGTPDFSPGHSDNGAQVVVGHDNWNNRYTVRNLATPHTLQTVIGFGSDWSQANHVSMLADDGAWALLSNYTANSGTVGPFRQEIFQAATDGSQNVRRLAHHHSAYAADYWNSPRANISRDGRFVAFTSNWGNTRRDVFIVEVPGTGGGGAGGNVVWTNAVNATATGNTLQKTGGCDGCADAGAWSQQTIAAGAGDFEFVVTDATKIFVAALTDTRSTTNATVLDYGIQINGAGVAEVRENGVYRADTSVTSGAVFKVAIAGGVVRYYKNGTLFYTSSKAPVYPMYANGILWSAGATIGNAAIHDTP